MRSRRSIPFALLILAAAAVAVGCSSQRAQWAVARQSLTATQDSLVAANRAHLLADKDLVAIEPFAKAAQGALSQVDAELTQNHDQPSNRAKFYLDAAMAALRQISRYQAVTTAK